MYNIYYLYIYIYILLIKKFIRIFTLRYCTSQDFFYIITYWLLHSSHHFTCYSIFIARFVCKTFNNFTNWLILFYLSFTKHPTGAFQCYMLWWLITIDRAVKPLQFYWGDRTLNPPESCCGHHPVTQKIVIQEKFIASNQIFLLNILDVDMLFVKSYISVFA